MSHHAHNREEDFRAKLLQLVKFIKELNGWNWRQYPAITVFASSISFELLFFLVLQILDFKNWVSNP